MLIGTQDQREVSPSVRALSRALRGVEGSDILFQPLDRGFITRRYPMTGKGPETIAYRSEASRSKQL